MDCFFTAFRSSLSNKLSRSRASDVEDVMWGVWRRAVSGSPVSSSSLSTYSADEEATGAGHSRLKRQRAAAFCMGVYICGMKENVRDYEDVNGKAEFLIGVGAQRDSVQDSSRKAKEEQDSLQWRQEKGKKRRKLGKEEWIAGGEAVNGNLLRRAPARLKKLVRRVRAKMRKMREVQKPTSFQYDPLSYSMNFDEGCWQQCEAHANLFCKVSSSAKSSCNSSNTGQA